MEKGVDNIFCIFALAAHGEGISGSDRIFIEFARVWQKKVEVNIFLTDEGRRMCARQKLKGKNIKFKVSNLQSYKALKFLTRYVQTILVGIKLGLTLKLKKSEKTILYSASEFWMDSFPCLILKLRYPKAKWAAAWYQTAPNPITGFGEGRYKIQALCYWVAQLPIKPLIARFSDFVLINNVEEKKQFPLLNSRKRALVVFGAVPLDAIKLWKQKGVKKTPKKFDAVFQGRFHPQKGVVELIDIWKNVVDVFPKAKLVMIGDGPLMADVKARIKSLFLEKNIELFGFVFDGHKKYKIFSQSKLVVHPAFYDSGGMASAEAMAFRIPAVGFRLPAYKSYYPKGMLKVKSGDLNMFSRAIIDLLKNSKKRNKIGSEALELIEKKWSWEKRAREIFDAIT